MKRKAQRENALTKEQMAHESVGLFVRDRVAKAASLGHSAAYDKCNSGYKGTIPVTPPELLAEAKLGLEIAARDTAINLRKGYSKDLYAKSDARLNKAFTRYQKNLVTQNCLREMIPRRETSESYPQTGGTSHEIGWKEGQMVLPTR